eukprot:jgi/Hompol1/5041/HPOL_000732-RA
MQKFAFLAGDRVIMHNFSTMVTRSVSVQDLASTSTSTLFDDTEMVLANALLQQPPTTEDDYLALPDTSVHSDIDDEDEQDMLATSIQTSTASKDIGVPHIVVQDVKGSIECVIPAGSPFVASDPTLDTKGFTPLVDGISAWTCHGSPTVSTNEHLGKTFDDDFAADDFVMV